MVSQAQFVDPIVSKTKFDREIEEYRSLESDYRSRGWLLVKAQFPEVVVVLAAPQLNPPAVITGVRFDYSNYDAQPPSVRLVNPFTSLPYKAKELNQATRLPRMTQVSAQLPPGFPIPLGAIGQVMAMQPLMQAYGPEDIPFLCLAGVREYHEHPGHSGDSWERHRKSGAGRLVRLLETIAKYAVQPITDYQYTLVTRINGFAIPQVPA